MRSVDTSRHWRHWRETARGWLRSTTIRESTGSIFETTNLVESPFASLRLRTDAAKRYERVDRAIAVIWKMLMVVEKRFRRLNAPELMKSVHADEKYEDGIPMQTAEEVAA